MTLISHTCVKPGCGAKYQDNEVDAYYCPPCSEQRSIIAKEIDAKIASRPRKEQVSDLQIVMERGQVRGNGVFVRAGDLGITFP